MLHRISFYHSNEQIQNSTKYHDHYAFVAWVYNRFTKNRRFKLIGNRDKRLHADYKLLFEKLKSVQAFAKRLSFPSPTPMFALDFATRYRNFRNITLINYHYREFFIGSRTTKTYATIGDIYDNEQYVGGYAHTFLLWTDTQMDELNNTIDFHFTPVIQSNMLGGRLYTRQEEHEIVNRIEITGMFRPLCCLVLEYCID